MPNNYAGLEAILNIFVIQVYNQN